MTPEDALIDVCRHFCAKNQHDDACIALRAAVADRDRWRQDWEDADARRIAAEARLAKVETLVTATAVCTAHDLKQVDGCVECIKVEGVAEYDQTLRAALTGLAEPTNNDECPSRCAWNDPCPDPWHDRGRCDHLWLDRPESDTRECLLCGTEVSG